MNKYLKVIINICIIIIIALPSYSFARGGSSVSSSGGRSSVSVSRSVSSPSKSISTNKSTYSTSKVDNNTTPLNNTNQSSTPKTAIQSQMTKVDNSQKSTQSLNSYKYEQTKFKLKDSPISNSITRSSPVYQSLPRVSSQVYTQQRTTFYTSNHYIMPSYGYQSYSHFGIWDSMALWFMLDHIHDSQYRSMYYNQQNNPDMIQWRKEADRLAKDNTELKAKLDDMDKEVSSLKGTPIDEKYVPKELSTIAVVPDDNGFKWGRLLFYIGLTSIIITGFSYSSFYYIKRRNRLKISKLNAQSW